MNKPRPIPTARNRGSLEPFRRAVVRRNPKTPVPRSNDPDNSCEYCGRRCHRQFCDDCNPNRRP